MKTVRAWHESVIIPTYEIGTPEKYPIFLEKRVYQGSSGAVYPHPVVEKISDEKVDKAWDAIFIENDFIKIMVLPALGGRIQMAYDKIQKRHFVYYNQVIKPALVGLTGPWISGGIEFNWPQHHRPSTYEATDFKIENNPDGSVTVWVSELERMFRTKGMAGFTLYPDKAYLEIKGQLYNRTPHAQTFLWWANPAVSVNDAYQSVFPPDVNAVFDHGKRDVSEFPIAKGEYYKVNYAPGTDISRYKNIPVPTSYMAINSDYDFVGGYENDTKGGLLHIADHHVSPGKKQWTWGNGDFGFAWDRNLTDEDGPYIELMCGVYTDNQPDFSWMHPYEERSFKQYFMPYYNVGVVKNATKEGMVNLELEQGKATVKIHVTGFYPNSTLVLKSENTVFITEKLDLNPANGYENTVDVGDTLYHELSVSLKDAEGNILISWQPAATKSDIIPEAAKAAKDPKNIESIEQLYLTGLHLEQYRHATYNPTDYYLEALSREKGDVRNNNAMGLWLMKHGQFDAALPYFDKAIETLTQRNPNPQDGEPYFNKGLTLNYLGKKDEAYKAFFKAAWNAAWQDASYFNLAQIDAAKGDLTKALELVDKSLIRNWHNHKARHLKVILLRKMGKIKEAKALISASLDIDGFNFGVLFEKYIISKKSLDLKTFTDLIRDNPHNYLEFAIDYAQAGQYADAIKLLSVYAANKAQVYPMVAYFMGSYQAQLGNNEQAKKHYNLGQKMPKDYCFPNRLEEVVVLKAVMESEKTDATAAYYLGNFWYAARQYDEAKTCWETSIKHNDNNAICHRNLALLYYNKTNQKDLARTHLEHAFELDNTDARLLMELDQLYKKGNMSAENRLKVLENNLSLTLSRDDLYLERASLYNFKGEHQTALDLINQRQFHPWEGGEGKVPFQYINANIELAKQFIKDGLLERAIQHLKDAQVYPHHLGEGKLAGAQENDINYWLGCAYEKMGNYALSSQYWQHAAEGLSDPSPAYFYNDQQPDKIFYQGMALLKLGKPDEAQKRFTNLLQYGQKHKNDVVKLDYFAVSLPDLLIWEEDLSLRNKIHCAYLTSLGELGLGNLKAATEAFNAVFSKDLFHLSAFIHQKMVEDFALVEV
jgi:tetratricopeptide (TPR) repeat protein